MQQKLESSVKSHDKFVLRSRETPFDSSEIELSRKKKKSQS